ncbi:hypothetical protein Mmc1_0934 [Magnetococcus marinus MC-1]|uniref:Uncharacterized protein n=1 Tax=Magnetococcus marinus (strain ATCC BAA-1437 / JCM 17883 / MC-1) TaxID=156889 RepID=A0L659_MAGMM|nr:hypothetical protein [Magnetococcus marinus]ABK43452.1 hypothetical protein Mmc1_0934 [Magnetococcus marinus MC-1]
MLQIIRLVTLILAVVGGGMLPFVVSDALKSYEAYQKAQQLRSNVLRLQGAYAEYQRGVDLYKAYRQRMSAFSQVAQDSGIVRGEWVRYEVDMKERLVDVPQMGFLLENARNGGHYYYDPVSFELFASEHPVMEKHTEAMGDDAGAEGSQALVSIKGTFLVYETK